MTLRNVLALLAVCAVLVGGTVASAAPIFYLSTSNATGVPGMLNLSGDAGATGTLYLWGSSSDVRVGGVSLDVVSANDALKFTGATGPSAGSVWSFGSTPVLAGNGLSVTGFNAAALPPGASGFGPGSPANDLLLGSLSYVLGASGSSAISLKVGANEITDYAGDYPEVRFGTANGFQTNGGAVGASGPAGAAQVNAIPEPATFALLGLAVLGGLGLRRRS